MKCSRAFTLIELLIVVAIVALLIALLAPVVSGVRGAAITVKCLNNMRNLQLAHWFYMKDNDAHFIDVGLAHGGRHGDEDVAWINTLQEYYDTQLLLKSPADTSPHWPLDQGGEGRPIPGTTDQFRRTSYGVNNYLVRGVPADPTEVYDRLHQIKAPQHQVQFVIMAETGDFAGADHPHVENWVVPGNPGATPLLAARQLATALHGGKEGTWDARSNYGFLDGHAETLRLSEVFLDFELNRFDPKVSHLYPVRQAFH